MTQLSQPRALTELMPARRSEDGKVAGVCSAVAQHWDVDPTLVRVVTLVLAVSGGIGLVLYVGAWLWMRPPAGGDPVVARLLPGAEGWSARRVAVTLGLASMVVLVLTSQLLPFGLGPVVVLVLAAVVARHLQRRAERPVEAWAPAPATPPPTHLPDPTTDFGRAVSAWHERLHTLHHGVVESPPVGPRPPVSPHHPELVADRVQAVRGRRRRSSWAFTAITLGAAALAWGLVDRYFAAASTLLLASSALAVIALGLLVGTVVGRPRLLVVTGLVLAVVVGLGLGPEFPGEPTAVRTWTSPAAVPVALSVTGQSMRVDATTLTLTEDRHLEVKVTGGALTLDIPDTMPWTISYDLHGGTLGTTTDDVAAGWSTGEFRGGLEQGPRLHLTISIRGGAVLVE